MTYDDYIRETRQNADHGLNVRHSYHDGQMQLVTRSRDHEALVREVYTRLRRALPLKDFWLEEYPQRYFSPDLRRGVYADLTVVRGTPETPPEDPDSIANPTVIIDVIDETNEAAARGTKWDIYRRLPSLRDYMLVSVDAPVIEVLSRETSDSLVWKRDVYGAGHRIEIASLELSIDVAPRVAVYQWFRG